MPRDLAVSFDAASRRFDLVLDRATRNLALDRTPASAMIMSVLSDRRARDDDDFQTAADPTAPPLLDPKRGWWADFMDPLGRSLGSRLWLLQRAKQTEATRRTAETMAAEGVADLEKDRGLSMLVAARWGQQRGLLLLLVRAGATEISVTRGVAA
jgi:phage gp46-like protein